MTPHLAITLPAGLEVRLLLRDAFGVVAGPNRDASDFSVIRVFAPGVVDQLRASPQFTTTVATPVTVDGFSGRAIDVEPAAGVTTQAGMFDTAETLTTVTLLPGSTAHVIELEVQGTSVIVMYSATKEAFAAHQKIAEAIIATLRFPDAGG